MDVCKEEEEGTAELVKALEKDEPLLQENPRRFVMFPIEHSDIWQFYKKAVGKFAGPATRPRALAPTSTPVLYCYRMRVYECFVVGRS